MVNITFDSASAGSVHSVKDPETGNLIKGSDMICLELMLDFGFLKDGIDSEYRRELPGKMIMQGFYNNGNNEGIPELADRNKNYWDKLIERLNSGDRIRVWYGNSPRDLCGIFHLCTLLKDYDNEVYAMQTPRYSPDDKGGHLINSWAEFNKNRLGENIENQRLMSRNEIKRYSEYWERLIEENAPLRAVISGCPVSVEEDFYDGYLLQHLPEDPVREATVIGDTLGHYHFGIDVSWYEYRIQKMIDDGRISVIKNHDSEAMKRTIQRADSPFSHS